MNVSKSMKLETVRLTVEALVEEMSQRSLLAARSHYRDPKADGSLRLAAQILQKAATKQYLLGDIRLKLDWWFSTVHQGHMPSPEATQGIVHDLAMLVGVLERE